MIGMLVASSPDFGAKPYLLGKGETIVGRGSGSDVLIPDASVSRRHAQIDRDEGGYQLQDLDSRNGTTVNGIAVVYKRLRNHDVVRFGDIPFVFQECEDAPATAPDSRTKPAAVPARNQNEATMEVAIPAAGSSHSLAGAAEAWKIVLRFATARAGSGESLFEEVADDIAGMSAIRHVSIVLPPGMAHNGERFIRRGQQRTPSAEERIRQTIETGEPVFFSRNMAGKGAPTTCEAIYLPVVFAAGKTGCMAWESNETFKESDLALARNIAEALAVAGRLQHSPVASARAIKTGPAPEAGAVEIVGRSTALQEVIRRTRKAAKTDSTVLIRGETGTGKELIARLIYEESARRQKPFLRVNVSSIQPDLMTDELFGHVKGAFSDAHADRKGYFEEADGGTLFLDEIGELTHEVQVKLLRVLQEGEFMRLGSSNVRRTNVRVVAATNRNLEAEVKRGAFRADLYYRLNVIEIKLPPLRERTEDIPSLVQHFMEKYRLRSNSPAHAISAEAMAALQGHRWRGNIRELQNTIERAMVLAESSCLEEADFQLATTSSLTTSIGGPAGLPVRAMRTLAEVERDHIAVVIAQCKGNMSEAARILDISRSALYAKTGRHPDAPADKRHE